MTTEVLAEAQRLVELGLSVIPIRSGEKAPGIKWTEYQERIANPAELEEWFDARPDTGTRFSRVGVVCGAVSGNLEMFEIEGRVADRLPDLDRTAAEMGPEAQRLWWTVRLGWAVKTPSGGIHWHIRTEETPPRNTKIAAADKTEIVDKETGELTGEFEQPVYAETRGEKGQTVVPPSDGWETIAGGPDRIPFLTADERGTLALILFSLDERTLAGQLETLPQPAKLCNPEPVTSPFTPGYNDGHHVRELGGKSPIDDWKEKTSWDEVMAEIGWREVRGGDEGQRAWLRPGDTSAGHSGYTGGENDNLFIFSTSTEFDEGAHTKESVIARHRFGNGPDAFKELTKALAKEGYGYRPQVEVKPRNHLSAVPDLQPTGTDPAPDVAPVTETVDVYTGDGMVQAFLNSHGHTTKCITTDKAQMWFVWDGQKWAHDPGAVLTARRIADHARRIRSGCKLKEERVFVDRIIAGGGMRAILSAVAREADLEASLEDFDQNRLEVNTPAGIVDLTTGEIKAHRLEGMHSKITGAAPDPNADRTLWNNFLNTTFGGDQDLIDFVQLAAGYTLIGRVDHQILFFLYGEGNNGKSVLVDTIASAMGEDYATSTPGGFLSKGMAQSEVKNTIELLRGRRFINIEETGSKATFDEAMVKKLTSTGQIQSRANFADYSGFKPSHTIWISGNFEPLLESGPSTSFMRRFRIIPFLHEIPADKVDPLLTATLAEEHAGAVLSWMIEGAVRYLKTLTLEAPEAVNKATREYVEDQDTVGQWLTANCVVGEAAADQHGNPLEESGADAREAYRMWCSRQRIDNPVTDPKQFALALKRHGVGQRRTAKSRLFTNLKIQKGGFQNLAGPVEATIHPSPFKTGAGVPDFSPGAKID